MAKCEFAEKEPCYMKFAKICNDMPILCKRRRLLLKGMTQEQIDDLWNVPEKYRERWAKPCR